MLPGTDLASARATVSRLAAASTEGWSHGLAPHRPGCGIDVLLDDADADLYRARSQRAVPARESSTV